MNMNRRKHSTRKEKKSKELSLTWTKKAYAFKTWLQNAEEDLTDPVHCNSIEEIRALQESHAKFQESLGSAQADLAALDQQIKSFNVSANPYTWVTMEALEEKWRNLQKIIQERDVKLEKEAQRQEENDRLRLEFAKHANAFHQWLTDTRMWLLDGSSMLEATDSLEAQLEATKRQAAEVRAKRRKELKEIEDLDTLFVERLILDNRYTKHSTVDLSQQCDQLDTLVLRRQLSLEKQIQENIQIGVSEDALKKFKNFDKEKSGHLNHDQFKSCLLALGYDLPMVKEGQPDPEFEAILEDVDPNRDGYVSLQEYMAFVISQETDPMKIHALIKTMSKNV